MEEPQNKFTAEDIVRYHSGNMSAQEMHRMEKAALEDPFLADALEGYVHAANPLEDLAQIKDRLHRRTRKKVVALPFSSKALKIAAMVVLLAGFAWIAFQYRVTPGDMALQKQHTKEAPLTTEKVSQDTTFTEAADAVVQQDRTEVVQTLAAPKKQKPVSNEPALGTTQAPATETATPTKDVEAADRMEAASARVSTAPPAAASRDLAMQRQSGQRLNMISGRVVDANNMAVPHAQLNVLEGKTTFRADANGAFQIPVQDSGVTVTVQSTGYQQSQAFLRNNAENRIVLQPAENTAGEVVLLKKSEEGNFRRQAAPRVTLEGAEPVAGTRSYERYVVEQLKPFESNSARVNGAVELDFEIDETGKPVDIRVQKSLCDSCDAAAIKVIKEGPQLKKTRARRRAKAKIVF